MLVSACPLAERTVFLQADHGGQDLRGAGDVGALGPSPETTGTARNRPIFASRRSAQSFSGSSSILVFLASAVVVSGR